MASLHSRQPGAVKLKTIPAGPAGVPLPPQPGLDSALWAPIPFSALLWHPSGTWRPKSLRTRQPVAGPGNPKPALTVSYASDYVLPHPWSVSLDFSKQDTCLVVVWGKHSQTSCPAFPSSQSPVAGQTQGLPLILQALANALVPQVCGIKCHRLLSSQLIC